MEATKLQYNGFNYLIHHLYTDCTYGKKSVYHVLTNNQKWCGTLLPEICGYPNVESKGHHDVRYKNNPTITNALKPYYTVDTSEDNTYSNLNTELMNFDVDTDFYYIFTYIEPYDD